MKLTGSLILFACLALAREKTDVVVMKNGDRLTCEVKRLQGGLLEVEFDYVDGTVAIDWLKVDRLESKALFLVQLTNGAVYSGTVIAAAALPGTPMRIEIQAEDTPQPFTVGKDDVVQIAQTSESFLRRFYADLSLGALYSKGNSSTQYNVGSELTYRQTRWGSTLTYNSNLSSSTGANTATRNQIELTAYRLMPGRNYYYGGTGIFLQSSVQGIQAQRNVALGLGRYLKNSSRVRFTIFGGVGWQRTRYEPSFATLEAQDVSVGVLSLNLEAFRFKRARIDATATAVPALTDTGRVFYRTNLTYYLKLFGKIDWNFSAYGNWDTRPPPNFQGSDYGSSTGVSVTFGNK